MEEARVIEGHHSPQCTQAIGLGDTVMVQVTRWTATLTTRWRKFGELAEYSKVIEAYLVSGEYDYLLRGGERHQGLRTLRERLYKIKVYFVGPVLCFTLHQEQICRCFVS
jgi:Lrp/AsnC family leucine-responsive transcriptional regulator